MAGSRDAYREIFRLTLVQRETLDQLYAKHIKQRDREDRDRTLFDTYPNSSDWYQRFLGAVELVSALTSLSADLITLGMYEAEQSRGTGEEEEERALWEQAEREDESADDDEIAAIVAQDRQATKPTVANRLDRIETALLLLEEMRDAKSDGMSSAHYRSQLDEINATIRAERSRQT